MSAAPRQYAVVDSNSSVVVDWMVCYDDGEALEQFAEKRFDAAVHSLYQLREVPIPIIREGDDTDAEGTEAPG
jgi:hypothetical protein